MAKKEKKKYTSIGGQALMEGIMMRGPHKTVMCVRRADGSIVTESVDTAAQTAWNKIPLLRGVVSFIQSMSLGTKMLMRSAEIAIEDEMNAEAEESAEAKAVEGAAEAEESAAAEEAAEAAESAQAEAAEEAAEAEESAEAEAAEEAAEAAEPAEAEAAEEAAEAEKSAETEAAEEAAEAAESAQAEAAEEAAEAVEPAKAEMAEEAAQSEKAAKPSAIRNILSTVGCILCLAVGIYMFFFFVPGLVTELVDNILPGILPQFLAENLAAYHERWLLGTGIVLKLVTLLLLFALVSALTSGGKEKKAKKKAKENDSGMGGDSGVLLFLSTVLGFAMAILLFSYVPTWVGSAMFKWVFPNVMPADMAAHLELQSTQNVWRPIIEGIVKILILVTYMLLISTMKEIRTLFQYHGAEHKTIACYEAGEELKVENVRKYRRFHPRCGTSFLILMVLVGIIVGMAAKYVLPADIANSNLWYPLIKIGLIPLMMGIGYELLKFSGKHDNILTRIISAPGMWMQRITTKEPTDEMIECAIAAITPVIPGNGEDMM